MKTQSFKAGDLRLVAQAPPPDDPPLMMGDVCTLNSGSPPLLVVDLDGDDLVVSWRCDCGVTESKLPRACVRRVAA